VLDVLIALFLVVPRRKMFGKIVGSIGFAGGPLVVVLLLFDEILHPPETHIKGFG
jgi:hydrogenase-4 membrane subunit HyfE